MIGPVLGTAFWWVVLVVVFRHERRAVRNGVLALIALWSTLTTAATLASEIPLGDLAILAGSLAMVLGVVALAVFLLANGLTVLRKEGRTLGNALSLAAGVAMVAAPVAALALALQGSGLALVAAVALGLLSLHVGMLFIVFLAASLLYQLWPERLDARGIIIHGAGLIRGDVGPLLRSRLDRAVVERERLLARGVDPLLVPSGGQGDDEPRSEGEAMFEYLVEEAGVPADRIAPETDSRTTEENLTFSHRLLADEGIDGPFTVSTSRYHAFRAALIARRLGLDDQAIGGPTAFYYVPSATLREFIAVMTYRKVWNVIALLPTLATVVLLLLVVI